LTNKKKADINTQLDTTWMNQVQAGGLYIMNERKYHGLDRKIQRLAERGLDHLGKYFTDLLKKGQVRSMETGQVDLLADWHEQIRLIINVVPHLVHGVRLNLVDDLEQLRASVRSDDKSYFDLWVKTLQEQHLPVNQVTLPLPIYPSGILDMGSNLPEPSEHTHRAFLILWNSFSPEFGFDLEDRFWLGLCLEAIKSIEFFQFDNEDEMGPQAPLYTPVVGADGRFIEWERPWERYLRYRGFQSAALMMEELAVRKPDWISGTNWFSALANLLVPTDFGYLDEDDKRPPAKLWVVNSRDHENCRTPALEYGYFVILGPKGPILHKIVDPLCWPSIDLSDPARTCLQLRLFDIINLQIEIDSDPTNGWVNGQIVHYTDTWDNPDEIIEELNKISPA
jgi:hypothetical protein